MNTKRLYIDFHQNSGILIGQTIIVGDSFAQRLPQNTEHYHRFALSGGKIQQIQTALQANEYRINGTSTNSVTVLAGTNNVLNDNTPTNWWTDMANLLATIRHIWPNAIVRINEVPYGLQSRYGTKKCRKYESDTFNHIIRSFPECATSVMSTISVDKDKVHPSKQDLQRVVYFISTM